MKNVEVASRSSARLRSGDGGFTMIEMMSVLALMALLLTLGAGAFRTYWLTQSLHGARDELVSHFRTSQEQVVSESHPQVFGARLLPGSSSWGLLEFDPKVLTNSADDTCTEISSRTLQNGVIPAVTPAPSFAPTAETGFCMTNLKYADGTAVPASIRAGSTYVWFYARGSATGGALTLEHGSLPDKQVSITVSPMTGRVETS